MLGFESIESAYREDETISIERVLPAATLPPESLERVQARAKILVKEIRERRLSQSGLDAFLTQYDLSSEEGVTLMCLAEALLRIPDKDTVDALIKDKLGSGNWGSHLGKSHSLFVNATTWGLLLTGKIVSNTTDENFLGNTLKKLVSKSSEPIIRQAIGSAMRILGKQFVMGRTIKGAIKRARKKEERGYRYSYDMLGEAAYTDSDAQKYFKAYQKAIQAVGEVKPGSDPKAAPGISVKLSALHPRFVIAKRERLHKELLPRLEALVLQAKEANIGLTVDAEEAHTLIITLELIQAIIEKGLLGSWNGFGIAVQAYQKRAPYVLDWLFAQLRKNNQTMMVRLVKGAYWDTEIKLAQVQGLSGYPVFTRKLATDINYIACVRKMLSATDVIYPQFATHNALTVATILELAKTQGITDFEFQCLHGMGDPLYDQIVDTNEKIPCRIYAPVGSHEDLLAYLVRRLLENGANTSFVNRIIDEKLPIDEMIADPVKKWVSLETKSHPKIPLPKDLFFPYRANSIGLDLNDPIEYEPVLQEIALLGVKEQHVRVPGSINEAKKRYSPVDGRSLGSVQLADETTIERMLTRAQTAVKSWKKWDADKRAAYLEKMGHLLQKHRNEFYSLLVFEGGKTLDDAVSEVREAIDYCNYYSWQARLRFGQPQTLEGPTGELNQLSLHGRGVIACISPWNFPLAIFLGQVTASLAAGNCVIAKPASQTILIASKAIELMHLAGFPEEVVQLLPVSGAVAGNVLVNDERINGIVFTGSTDTARDINQKLAARKGPIVPLIAETGGQNVMIVDSTALPEQVTQDVITSAFRSAGQRCSALRVLFLQEEVADKILTMLQGAMVQLSVGDPSLISTDVGPVIDDGARKQLQDHIADMQDKMKNYLEIPLGPDCEQGAYFAPRLMEIASLDLLTHEVFGPVLHVIRYQRENLGEVIAQINRTGYGLTLGIHTRINETVNDIIDKVRVGNIYVNRNMIGAVVGVQPFGGEGLSGTGPKAGGPHYLPRLASECTVSINTTAAGGNATLMSLDN